MLLVYVILIVVSSCTTIVAVYFILNAENYHWQWISFIASVSSSSGGSSSRRRRSSTITTITTTTSHLPLLLSPLNRDPRLSMCSSTPSTTSGGKPKCRVCYRSPSTSDICE